MRNCLEKGRPQSLGRSRRDGKIQSFAMMALEPEGDDPEPGMCANDNQCANRDLALQESSWQTIVASAILTLKKGEINLTLRLSAC